MNKDKVAGVIGGLGPMSTVYFFEMIVRLTDAKCDQDHIDMIITNRATTYDRTEYIIKKSDKSPLDTLILDVKKLENAEVDFIVITCNTAHYWYEKLQENVNIPILNMIEETVLNVKNKNKNKVCILATEGTVTTKTYQNMCQKYDVECMVPNEKYQQMVMDIIYKDIKAGKSANMENFNEIISYAKDNGCDCVILGCTELSILKVEHDLPDDFYIDSLKSLATKTIEFCGKKVIE